LLMVSLRDSKGISMPEIHNNWIKFRFWDMYYSQVYSWTPFHRLRHGSRVEKFGRPTMPPWMITYRAHM
jgi:hypothetical protein